MVKYPLTTRANAQSNQGAYLFIPWGQGEGLFRFDLYGANVESSICLYKTFDKFISALILKCQMILGARGLLPSALSSAILVPLYKFFSPLAPISVLLHPDKNC